MKQHRAKNRRSGFTLIEVLVVITVIAVLIAMLLPSLGAARGVAQSAVCMSQVRQLSLACTSYATDSKNALPRYNYGDGNPYTTPVLTLLAAQYLPHGPLVTIIDDVVSPVGGVELVPGLRCPSEVRDHVVNAPGWNVNLPAQQGTFRNGVGGEVNTGCGATVWDVTFASWGYRYFSHYQFASAHATYYFLNYPGTAPIAVNDGLLTSVQPHIRISSIVNPADTWLSFDGNDYRFSAGCAVFRHAKIRANFTYADGHAQPLGMSDVDGNATYTNLTRDQRSVIER